MPSSGVRTGGGQVRLPGLRGFSGTVAKTPGRPPGTIAAEHQQVAEVAGRHGDRNRVSWVTDAASRVLHATGSWSIQTGNRPQGRFPQTRYVICSAPRAAARRTEQDDTHASRQKQPRPGRSARRRRQASTQGYSWGISLSGTGRTGGMLALKDTFGERTDDEHQAPGVSARERSHL